MRGDVVDGKAQGEANSQPSGTDYFERSRFKLPPSTPHSIVSATLPISDARTAASLSARWRTELSFC